MSTVPKAGDPAPANNAKTLTIGDGSGMYARPTPGGAATGNDQGAGPAPMPGYSINWTGASVSTGDTQTGSDIGSGTTLVVGQPDATGHPASDAMGFGTVGDSGNQAGPADLPANARPSRQ